MTLVSVVKDKGILTFTYSDGTVLNRNIIYSYTMVSEPPDGYLEIGNCYINGDGDMVVNYNGGSLVVGAGGDMTKAVYDADDDGTVDDSEKLEGSTKAEVQDHTPKAHTLDSHSSKAHSELTGVGVSDHHVKYTDAEAIKWAIVFGG